MGAIDDLIQKNSKQKSNTTVSKIPAPILTDPFSSKAESTPKQTNIDINPLNIAKDIAQMTARSVGTVGTTAGNIPFELAGQSGPFEKSIPTTGSKVTEAIFGGKPIETFGERVAKTQESTAPFLTKIGSELLAPTLVGASIAMDLSGFGGPKKVTSFTKGLVPEKFFNTIAKDTNPESIVNTLKGVGFGAEDATKLSSDLAKADTSQLVKNVFLDFEKGMKPEPLKLKYSEEGIPLSTKKLEARLAESPKELYKKPLVTSEPNIPVPKGLSQLSQNITPLKYVDESTKKIFRDWNVDTIKSKELATQEIGKVSIPNDSMDLINRYQAGEAIPEKAQIQKIFDDLLDEAKKRGLDIPKRANYVPQVYQGTAKEIQDAVLKYLKDKGLNDEFIQDYIKGVKTLPEETAKRLKLTPSFERERTFANYKVAEEYGLKPRYTKIADLVAYYRGELEKTLANKKLLDNLAANGKILPDQKAPRNWIVLNNEFTGGATYRAPANTAKVINNIFTNPDTAGLGAYIVEKASKASKFAQEIALSAGVPGTTINFFAIGQLIKEITSGNIKAVNAFLRANSNSQTVKFFNEYKKTILDMAEQGIDLGDRTGAFHNQQSLKELIESFKFKEAIGLTLDRAFGKKTFESFMPMLQVQVFDDIVKQAIKNGLPEDEAKKLGGQIMKNNFGLTTDSFAQGKVTKDTLASTFFAPRFRESIIKTLFNTGKAGTNLIGYLTTAGKKVKLDPTLARNRKLLYGMILTYGLYDYVNTQLNEGKHMWDNPSGKEFALRIPLPNGEIIYVEFMPSFLAFARNLGSGTIALAKGDFETAGQKFGTVFSMPIKITSELLTNKDYFGNQIYKETDTGKQKVVKIAEYAGLQVNHPYIKEIVNQLDNKKPLYQSLITALELPLKFSTETKESTSNFYSALEEKRKEAAQAKTKFTPKFDEIQNLIRQGKIEEAKAKVNSLTDDEYEMYKTMKTALKTSATNSGKAAMKNTYDKIQELVKQGREDEAKIILNSLSEDEYKYYTLLKKQFAK